ncbi:LOW QUALITY PROTEIN: thioredoxin-like protein 4A [Lycaon pictus]
MLPHLHNSWSVDQAILSEEDLMVVICFGHDWDPMCMKMDEVLYSMAKMNKHIMIAGSGNNNKINWATEDKQEMINAIETVYWGTWKSHGLVVSPKDYFTKYNTELSPISMHRSGAKSFSCGNV